MAVVASNLFGGFVRELGEDSQRLFSDPVLRYIEREQRPCFDQTLRPAVLLYNLLIVANPFSASD
jgi:hypothetical protein